MSIEISHNSETSLTDEAERQGISVDALLERLISERSAAQVAFAGSTHEFPILRLGAMGTLHRRDIYDDVRRAGGSQRERSGLCDQRGRLTAGGFTGLA